MRWERFFEDLEQQLDSEWEAERAALDTEAERLRLARLRMRERLAVLSDAASDLAVDLVDQSVVRGRISGLGADWVILEAQRRRLGAALVPAGAIAGITVGHPDLLRSARPDVSLALTSERMTLGFVLRDLVRRRAPVRIHTVAGRVLSGTIDRAGADHLDLALHDVGQPRRSDAVAGYRVVPYPAIVWVDIDPPRA